MNSHESIKKSLREIMKVSEIRNIELIDCHVTCVYQEGEGGYGTIDVATMTNNAPIMGVSLSALYRNNRGNIKLPTLTSEVTVALINGQQGYVVKYTHLDSELIDVNKLVKIGATAYEEPTDTIDYDEVAAIGKASNTEYRPESITSVVVDDTSGGRKSNLVTDTPTTSEHYLGDESSGKSSKVEQSIAEIKLSVGGANIEQKEGGTKITGAKHVIGNGGSTEEAVLGQKLKTFLDALITQLSLVMTTTSLGPQPILNKVAVDALKLNLDTIMSTTLKIQ